MSVSKNILLFLSFAFLTTAYICAFSEDPTRPVESALFYTSLIFILVALLILATVLPSVSEEAVTKCIHLRNGQSVYVWTLIVAGIIMRVAGLDRIPPGLWYDEANHGLDAIALLEGFTLPVYFISNCGQEPIFKYLIAGSICLFSNTVYALRLIPALSGLMTVLLIYFMLKSAFSRTTAVLTTGFFVFNPWHFHFSRIAFRSILVPVWIALTVILIQYRGRFSGKRYHLLLGIISGLGLYTYVSYRIFPFLVVIYIICRRDYRLKSNLSMAGAYFAGLFICSLPLVWIGWKDPSLLVARQSLTSVFAQQGNLMLNLSHNLAHHIFLYVLGGDPILRHGLPGRPLASFFETGLFIVGMACALRSGRSSFSMLGLLIYLGMLIPGVLSVPVQAPASLRSLGSLPGAIIMTAAGISYLISRSFLRNKVLTLILILLPVSALMNTHRYFFTWRNAIENIAPKDDCEFGFCTSMLQVLAELEKSNPDHTSWFLTPQFRLHTSIRYLSWKHQEYFGVFNPEYFKYQDIGDRDLAVVITETRRNLWWLRDSPLKNFFWFWETTEHLTTGELQAMIGYCYPREGYLMQVSDEVTLRKLREFYPGGLLKRENGFSVYRVSNEEFTRSNKKLLSKD